MTIIYLKFFYFQKKLKTIYATGSSILLYEISFQQKKFLCFLKNLNINFAYAKSVGKIFKKIIDVIRLDDYYDH